MSQPRPPGGANATLNRRSAVAAQQQAAGGPGLGPGAGTPAGVSHVGNSGPGPSGAAPGASRPRPLRPPSQPSGYHRMSPDSSSPHLSARSSVDSTRGSQDFSPSMPLYPSVPPGPAPVPGSRSSQDRARSPPYDGRGVGIGLGMSNAAYDGGFGGNNYQQQQGGGWNNAPNSGAWANPVNGAMPQQGPGMGIGMGMGNVQQGGQRGYQQQPQRASSPNSSWYSSQQTQQQQPPYSNQSMYQPQPSQAHQQMLPPIQQQQQHQQPSGFFSGQNQSNILSSTLQNLGMDPLASSLLSAPLQAAIGSQIQSRSAATVKGLKYYFDVSNSYVLKKIGTVLFPWRKASWARLVIRGDGGNVEGYRSPRADENAPDLYVPTMGFVTYILLVGLLLGRANRFHPALLGSTASTAFAVLVFETIMVRLGCYLLGVGQEGGEGWADVVAVLGYKFVGIIVTMLIKFLLPWSSLTYGVFIYVAFAHGFFLLRTLRSLVLPEQFKADQAVGTHYGQDKKRRVYFLFLIAAGAMFMSAVLLRVGWY